ncbi:MAG: dicarboxylate transporter/tellurite-resistance protein TehA [Acinetobacter sp.]|nr:dicarboxylate transporter/tellurite-resistance protein TehA [Acinetobacter sp.]
MNTSKPFFMPTAYFAIALGLGALSLAWQHASHLFTFSHIVSNALGILSLAVWALFLALYAYKIVAYREQVLDEWHCPLRFSLLALMPICTIIAGEILTRWHHGIGELLIWLGIIAQISYATLRIGTLWRGDIFTEQAVQPAFYLPAVAANFTSASALALLGHHDVGYLFFGAGLIAWLVYEPVLLQHLRLNMTDAAARPTLGIILAPAFVGASAYLSLNGGQVDFMVKCLWGYGFLQLLFLLRMLPWIAEKGFSVGFWGFSFGLASMVSGAVVWIETMPNLAKLAWFAFGFGNVMIAILILGTLLRIVQGRFWLKG